TESGRKPGRCFACVVEPARPRAEENAARGRAVSTYRGRVPPLKSHEFSWIQNVIRIESLFQAAMKIACNVARCLRPPAFFCQADSVFACDHAAPPQHLGKKIVERAFDFFAHSRIAIVSIGHDVDVNIAVPGVTKARNRKSMLCL